MRKDRACFTTLVDTTALRRCHVGQKLTPNWRKVGLGSYGPASRKKIMPILKRNAVSKPDQARRPLGGTLDDLAALEGGGNKGVKRGTGWGGGGGLCGKKTRNQRLANSWQTERTFGKMLQRR